MIKKLIITISPNFPIYILMISIEKTQKLNCHWRFSFYVYRNLFSKISFPFHWVIWIYNF